LPFNLGWLCHQQQVCAIYAGKIPPPKDAYFSVNVYSQGQSLPPAQVYYVIGKVSVEGFASYGVTPEGLMNQARKIARVKGADAIINSNTVVFHYLNGDALLRFKGELIVYAPAK